MVNRSTLITSILLMLVLTLSVSAQEVLQRGENHNLLSDGNGGYSLQFEDGANSFVEGQYVPVNTSIVPMNNSHEYYQYGYRHMANAKFNGYFKNNAQQNYPIAFTYKGYAIRMEPEAVGYVDPSNGFQKVVLDTVRSSTPVINDDVITYPNAFYGADIQFSVQKNRLKEDFICKTQCVTAIQNNLPRKFGLSNTQSYLVWRTKLQFLALDVENGGVVRTAQNFTTQDKMFFKDALGELKFLFPVVNATDAIGNTAKITNRLEFEPDGNAYLYSGIKLTEMNGWTAPIYFDPTTETKSINETEVIELPSDVDPLITLKLHNVSSGTLTLQTNFTQELPFDPEYAVDPTNLTFTNMTVRVAGVYGENFDQLLKCPTWNITTATCGGDEWIQVNESDILYHNETHYEFLLYPEDPGFIEYKSSQGENSTTSLTPQLKVSINVTAPFEADFLLMFSSFLGSSSTSREVEGIFKIDGEVFTTSAFRPKDTNNREFFGGHAINTYDPTSHNASIFWRATTSPMIAYIRQGHILAMQLNEYFSILNDVEEEVSTTPEIIESLVFNVTQPGEYLILASGETQAKTVSQVVELRDNGNVVQDLLQRFSTSTDRKKFLFHNVSYLEPGVRNFSIFSYTTGAGTSSINKTKITAIRMTDDYAVQSNQSNFLSNTTSTTYVNKGLLQFTPQKSGQHIIIGTAQYASATTNGLAYVNLSVDGIEQCEGIRESASVGTPGLDQDSLPFGCVADVNLSAFVQHNITIDYRASTGEAKIENAHITAFFAETEVLEAYPFSPANNSYDDSGFLPDIDFTCEYNVTPVYNVSLYLTNNTGGNWHENQTGYINGSVNTNYTFTVPDLKNGVYTWGCYGKDGYLNEVFSANYTFTSNFSDPNGQPNVTLNYPISNPVLYDDDVNFNWSVEDVYVLNDMFCNISIDDVTNISSINSQYGTGTSNNYTIADIGEGAHTWSVLCEDGYGNVGYSVNESFFIDVPYGNLTTFVDIPTTVQVQGWFDVYSNTTCSGDTCALVNATIYGEGFDTGDCELRASTPDLTVSIGQLNDTESATYTWEMRCDAPNVYTIGANYSYFFGAGNYDEATDNITILYGKNLFENIFSNGWYEPGDTAILGVSVEDFEGNPFTGFNLSTNVYYPNGTVWISNLVLTEFVDGLYKTQVTLPTDAPYGDYIYTVQESFFIASSFQVKNLTDLVETVVNVSNAELKVILEGINETTTSIEEYVIDINATVYDIDLFLNQTLYAEVDQVEELLAQVLQNNSVMFDTLLNIQSNVSTISDNLNNVQDFLVAFNASTESNFVNVVAEIDANEAKLDVINATVNTILSEIQNTINPSLTGIEGNISDMQIDLELIINQTDTLEAGQAQILQNLSYLVLDLVDLEADMFAINESIHGRIDSAENTITTNISDSTAVILSNIAQSEGAIINEISSVNASIQDRLTNINESLFNKIMSESGLIQNEIQLINGSLVFKLDEMNLTIHSRFDSVDANLANISAEITNTQARLDCTFSFNVVCNKLDDLLLNVEEINATTQAMNQYLTVNITDFLNGLNATLQGLQADVTYIRSQSDLIYNDTQEILINWGTLTAQDIYDLILDANSTSTNIQSWLDAFNVTEESRHNVTQELVIDLDGDLSAINVTIESILTGVNTLSGDLLAINQTIVNIEGDVQSLNNDVLAINQTNSAYFNGLNLSLQALQSSVDTVSANLLAINGTLSGDIADLDADVQVVQETLNNLTIDVDALNSSLSATFSAVVNLTGDVAQVSSDLLQINATTNAIYSEVLQLSTDIAIANSTLNNVYSDTQELLGDVDGLNLTILTLEGELLAINQSITIQNANNFLNLSDHLDDITFQLLDIDQHIMGLIANISNIQELTSLLNGTIQYEITDVHRVVSTETYKTQLTLTDITGKAVELDTVPTIILIDPLNNTIVSAVPMENVTNGVWEYEYITSAGSNVGNWITEVTATYNNETFYLYDSWTLISNPTQVLVEVIRVCPEDVVAEITIQNEGTTPYEYQYFWWTTDNPFEDWGGPTVHDLGSGAKLLQPGEIWITTKTLDNIKSEGTHYFRAKTFFGEYSFATDTYTEESFNCPSLTKITGQAVSDDILIPKTREFGLTALSWFLIFNSSLFIIFLFCKRENTRKQQ